MICPKCKQDSLSDFGQVEGVEIDFCSGCKGIWFDSGELAFYVEAAEDVPRLDAVLATARLSDLSCPRCQAVLAQVRYLPGEPLIIDVCPSCRGIFLDPGELPQLEALAARKGGLSRVQHTVQALERRGYLILGAG